MDIIRRCVYVVGVCSRDSVLSKGWGGSGKCFTMRSSKNLLALSALYFTLLMSAYLMIMVTISDDGLNS